VARFFFHVANGDELRDDGGMDLNSLKEAREEALLTASELLGGDGPFWRLPAWAVRVTDDAGKDVFTVKVTMIAIDGSGHGCQIQTHLQGLRGSRFGPMALGDRHCRKAGH
jgi:hypothetical protein